MVHRYSILAATLLLLAACGQVAEAPVEYRPGEAGTVDHALCLLGFAAIPLGEVSTGHHLVEASINGTSGRFVLDTGANVTVISEGHARRFGVSAAEGGSPGSNVRLSSAAGRTASQVRIETFEVGSIPIRQNRVVIADLGQLLTTLGQVADEDVAGIIGQDVLTEHRAIIDVARPMLYLMNEDTDPAPVPAEDCGNPDQS